MVDARDLKSLESDLIPVQVRSRAPIFEGFETEVSFFLYLRNVIKVRTAER